ncbi:hypothetical protein GCM10027058_31430 [Microbacterium neimengense]
MSAVTYSCVEPDCEWRQSVPSRRARSADAVRERAEHGGSHPSGAGFAARERWAWLWPLFAVNLVWLGVSVYAAVTNDFAVGVFAPQVAMLQAWWIGAIEVVIIAVGTFAYASTAPAGASFWRRAFAGLTMSAFLVMVGNAAAAFALLFFIGALFASSP